MAEPVLIMKGIQKHFGSTVALDNVDLILHQGEILGLIGENGAGKSTLVKILSGAYTKDGGEIILNKKKIDILDTDISQKSGISIIYQELSLFPDLDAVDNIFIHREILKGKSQFLFSLIDKSKMRNEVSKLLSNEFKVNINLKKPVHELRLAERQLIEIARAISSKSQIIVMDEPTAALEKNERENLFNVINNLKQSGSSIIYVSHYLDEVLRICDRVVILRDGKNVGDMPVQELDVNKAINYMIGKSIKQQYPKEIVEIGKTILSVKGLSKEDSFRDISFDVHQGEIIGIAGLAGCGKNELVRSLFGVLKYNSGQVELKGKAIKIKNVKFAMKNKMAFLPAERKIEGLFLEADLGWNITIASLQKLGRLSINRKKEVKNANNYISELGIKANSAKQTTKSLSGGNQQKVMIARWLMTTPDLILLEEPTRGIDVNSKTEVYKLIAQLVKMGKGVIMVSSEAPELLGICDRIIVMYEGGISKIIDAKEASEEKLAFYQNNQLGGNEIA